MFSEAAMIILQKPGMEKKQSRIMALSQGLCFHWTSPLRETLAPLLEGHRLGMRSGDVESAGHALSFYLDHIFYAGCPLNGESVTALLARHIGDTETVGSNDSHALTQEMYIQNYLLTMKKLQGTELEENERDYDDILNIASETDNSVLRGYVYVLQLELSSVFGEWKDASEILRKTGDIRDELLGSFGEIRFTFLESLISIKAARLSSGIITSRRWRYRAIKSLKLMRLWKKNGNPNITHSLHLLEAELAAFEGKKRRAQDCYKSAIAVAYNNNFLQDLALSHELASVYYGNLVDDLQRDHHRENAIRYYSEWGATAKIKQLESRWRTH